MKEFRDKLIFSSTKKVELNKEELKQILDSYIKEYDLDINEFKYWWSLNNCIVENPCRNSFYDTELITFLTLKGFVCYVRTSIENKTQLVII